jgi:adenylate cyclase class IV
VNPCFAIPLGTKPIKIMKTKIVYSFNYVHVKLDAFNGRPRYFIELLDDSIEFFNNLDDARRYAESYANYLEAC